MVEAPIFPALDRVATEAQSALDTQRGSAADAAKERVKQRTGLDLDALGEEPVVAQLAGFTASDSPAEAAQRAVEAAWGPHHPAEMVSTGMVATLVSDEDQPVDPRQAAFVLHRLGDGFQLRVQNPHGLGLAVTDLVTDLAMYAGGVGATLYYGIRSALGEPPTQSRLRRFHVQLAGRRSASVNDREPSGGVRLGPGSVTYVPPERRFVSLPADSDSLHLAIEIADGPEATREASAMTPVLMRRDWGSARAVIDADPTVGWPMRLSAPGGVQVDSVDDDVVTVILGGHELRLEPPALPVLTTLADGAFHTGQELAGLHDLDTAMVVDFTNELWRHGLLEPRSLDPSARLQPNERLTQVASAGPVDQVLIDGLLAQIDETQWRPPVEGEVPISDVVPVEVQPVSSDMSDLQAQLLQIAASMNAQFFRCEIASQQPEAMLLVRLRSTDSGESSDRPAYATPGALHSDIFGAGSTRKVTFVLSLTDAAGGWVQLPAGSPATESAVGMVSAWPSLRPWSFASVEAGERLLLVGRLHGPAFR